MALNHKCLSLLTCLPARSATVESRPVAVDAAVVLPTIHTPKHANMPGLLGGGKHEDSIQKTHVGIVVVP